MTERDKDAQDTTATTTGATTTRATTTRTAAAGDVLPSQTLPITRDDLRRYADASGDRNPIHLDDEAAQALGLPGVVAHGMLTSALAIGVVAEWAGGADRVVATSFRFAGPVVVPADAPAQLEVAGAVKKVGKDGSTADGSTADGSTADVALTVTCGGAKVFGKAIVTVSLAG